MVFLCNFRHFTAFCRVVVENQLADSIGLLQGLLNFLGERGFQLGVGADVGVKGDQNSRLAAFQIAAGFIGSDRAC